jgi:hypothetical protein
MGIVAMRLPDQELLWDSESLRITNVDEANAFLGQESREGWSL